MTSSVASCLSTTAVRTRCSRPDSSFSIATAVARSAGLPKIRSRRHTAVSAASTGNRGRVRWVTRSQPASAFSFATRWT